VNALTIAGRELRSYFGTALGWLVLAGFLVVVGFFWFSMVTLYVEEGTQVGASPYAASQFTYANYLLSPFFGNTSIVLLMVCPALSMRSFAEERRSRTIELLLTSPVATWEIVLGKFLGAVGFVAVMLVGTFYVPLTLKFWGTGVDWGVLAAGYLAMVLVSAALLALGLMFSSMTSNPMMAMVLSFAAGLVIWLLSWMGEGSESVAAQISLASHFADLTRGAVKLSDLVYYAGFTSFFLFATHQRVDSYRWS
jgi:ABC-2 type transport system permease protein